MSWLLPSLRGLRLCLEVWVSDLLENTHNLRVRGHLEATWYLPIMQTDFGGMMEREALTEGKVGGRVQSSTG